MILYIEKQAIDYPQTKKIIQKFKNSKIIYIDNYKNIFDKDLSYLKTGKSLIVAKLNSPSITEAPAGYGHTESSFFIKTSLNCIYDCSYCYLKGAFKNENMIVFVNYDDIKKQILDKVKTLDKTKFHRFYSGDYSDILGMDMFTDFIKEFTLFFEQFENVKMEIRTKSSNIKPIIDLGFVPKNTEIAFSLNPQSLIDEYEKGTSSLVSRLEAIKKLQELGFLVGVRYLPLLPVKDYEKIYGDFIDLISNSIDINKTHSSFASGLLYTKKDYNKILSKYKTLDILHMLELNDDGFYRESKKVRDTFYTMFKKLDKKCILCLEY